MSLLPRIRRQMRNIAYNPAVDRFLSPGNRKPDADDRNFDAVIFSEVLYYLDVDAGIQQVRRYAGFLQEGGVIIVSMKDDAKSARIFRDLKQALPWQTGILSQIKPSGPEYSIGRDSARPAFLIGVFGKPGS